MHVHTRPAPRQRLRPLQSYRVINGCENGSPLGELLAQTGESADIKHNDIFIDNVSGDIYSYNFEGQKWIPLCNAGLHYHKAAQQYITIGKYVLKSPVFHPKSQISSQMYINSRQETICYVKNQYLNHWLLSGLSHSFKIPIFNNWDVHAFANLKSERQLVVLAETERGPSIIELDHIVATQFGVMEKYPCTISILTSYISYYNESFKSQKLEYRSIIASAPEPTGTDLLLRHKKKQAQLYKSREIKQINLANAASQSKGSARPSYAGTPLAAGQESAQRYHLSKPHRDSTPGLADNNFITEKLWASNMNRNVQNSPGANAKSPKRLLQGSDSLMNFGLDRVEKLEAKRRLAAQQNHQINFYRYLEGDSVTSEGKSFKFYDDADEGELQNKDKKLKLKEELSLNNLKQYHKNLQAVQTQYDYAVVRKLLHPSISAKSLAINFNRTMVSLAPACPAPLLSCLIRPNLKIPLAPPEPEQFMPPVSFNAQTRCVLCLQVPGFLSQNQ